MIILNTDSLNNVYVTFTELMTDASNPVLLKMVRDSSPSQEYFALLTDNTSTSIGRYDLYVVQLVNDIEDIDIENAITWLPATGSYTYYALELNGATPFNIDNLDIIKQVEQGKVYLKGDLDINPVYQ